MILITGATGRIGKRVVHLLHKENAEVRVLVRDAEKAARLLPAGVQVCVGDLADRRLLTQAMEDVGSVLLVSPVSPEQTVLEGNVVEAATTRNARIVKISGLGTSPDSTIDSGRWHAATEARIRDTGLQHTFLRPLFFMQNLNFLFESARTQGIIQAAVGDARIAMIDADDIAGVAAHLLLNPDQMTNQELTLTTREAVSYSDVARVFSRQLGREVRYLPQTMEEVQLALERSGQPDWHIRLLLQFNQAFQNGMGEICTDHVTELLGREPVTLTEYLERELTNPVSDESDNPFPVGK